MADVILSPGTAAGLIILPKGGACWSGLHSDIYPCGSPESDICSSFILYFLGLDVPLPIHLVRNMLAYSTGYPYLTINEPKGSINLGHNQGSPGWKETWIQRGLG